MKERNRGPFLWNTVYRYFGAGHFMATW